MAEVKAELVLLHVYSPLSVTMKSLKQMMNDRKFYVSHAHLYLAI